MGPVSQGLTGEYSMGLKVLIINAGKTTDTRLINTIDIVMKKIIQFSILCFFCGIREFSGNVIFFNIYHISVYVHL